MLVKGTWLCLVVVAASTKIHAFSPAAMTTMRVSRRIPTTTVSAGLEVVEDEDVSTDPFDLYKPVPEQTEVCIKDTYVSTTGMAVGTNAQEVLTLQYTANFNAEDSPQFDFADNFVCKTGSSAMLPGFEEGVMGMKVGGKRIIRIPPNKGYGDKWFKGTIPPNSHLEFTCELTDLASTPQEMFLVQWKNFGIARSLGLLFCGGYLALSPFHILPGT